MLAAVATLLAASPGVFRRVLRPTHHQLVAGQIELVRAEKGEGVLRDLLFTSDTWEVS